ncbi:MAG: hypothetical protein L0215_26910, partial [Gemmataceae bacterium]|nr:hypothetical protein [Gemmataceae bacterium]
GVTLAWLADYFAARWLLRHAEVETWLRVCVALFPLPFFAGFLWVFISGIRSMDELQRKIQLEALAIAFPLAILLLMTLGLLQRAVDLPFEDWSYAHVWIYLPLFYFGGVAIASRRYQ